MADLLLEVFSEEIPARMQRQAAEDLKRLVGLARSFGVPMDLVTPSEAHNMFPLMAMDGVVGAAFTPNDGVIDPFPDRFIGEERRL